MIPFSDIIHFHGSLWRFSWHSANWSKHSSMISAVVGSFTMVRSVVWSIIWSQCVLWCRRIFGVTCLAAASLSLPVKIFVVNGGLFLWPPALDSVWSRPKESFVVRVCPTSGTSSLGPFAHSCLSCCHWPLRELLHRHSSVVTSAVFLYGR